MWATEGDVTVSMSNTIGHGLNLERLNRYIYIYNMFKIFIHLISAGTLNMFKICRLHV